jgi:hypothetical protein
VPSNLDLRKERDYQHLLTGLLYSQVNPDTGYLLDTNRESGQGRYDVSIPPLKDATQYGAILELKHEKKADAQKLEKLAQQALDQIIQKQYAKGLRARGAGRIKGVGLAFSGKKMAYVFQELE